MNPVGTAPGLAMDVPATQFGSREQPNVLVMLPGPPREMRPLFQLHVVPLLKERFQASSGFMSKIYHTLGIGESRVEDALSGPLKPLTDRGLELGFCARTGEVDVRLTASGNEAASLIETGSGIVVRMLRDHIYSDDGSSLNEVVIRELRRQGQSVVAAESCTGGFVSNLLTDIPGASEVFIGGFVTYSNKLKMRLLGVRKETLEAHGAVSEETAREMAVGARDRYGADFAISITGIAGPTGGTPDKPVGTVFIGLACADDTEVVRATNAFDRAAFKYVTGRQALDMLRRRLTMSH
jgi:nicotinamide-nucleotide amidase